CDGPGHAGAARDRVGRQAGARLDEQAVRVSVVGAPELDDEVPPGRRPRDAECAHHRLGPRRCETKAFDRRHGRADRLAELDLERVGRAEGQPVAGSSRDGLEDLRMTMTKDGRPPGADEIDKPAAVGVPHVRTIAALENERRATDRPERPYWAVHPAR